MPLEYSKIDEYANKVRRILGIKGNEVLSMERLVEIVESIGGSCNFEISLGQEAKIIEKHDGTIFEIAIDKTYIRDHDDFDIPLDMTKEEDINARIDDQIKQKVKFIIAHELGHLFLHTENKENGSYSLAFSEFGSYGQIETEADSFASCFLMPKTNFLKETKKSFEIDKSNDMYFDAEFLSHRYGLETKRILNRSYDLEIICDY